MAVAIDDDDAAGSVVEADEFVVPFEITSSGGDFDGNAKLKKSFIICSVLLRTPGPGGSGSASVLDHASGVFTFSAACCSAGRACCKSCV